MGGGHVSRPDFGMPQPDPAYPLTEFYLLLQRALDAAGCFALPALYAALQAPARHIYLDEARDYLTLSPTAAEGSTRLLAEGSLQLLYSTLHVQPDGTPAALGRRLVHTAAGKRWLHHPRAETFLAERVALLQRVYRR